MKTLLIRVYRKNNKLFSKQMNEYNNRSIDDIKRFLRSYNSNWNVRYYNFGYTRIAKKEYYKDNNKIEIIETLHETI